MNSACNSSALSGILYIVKNILLVIEIIVPILLVLYITIELVRLANNPDEKKTMKRIYSKVIALIIIFLIPVIINAVMYILGENTDISSCWNVEEVNYNSTYLSTNNKNKNIINNQSGYEKGEERTKSTSSTNTPSNISFNLQHAIQVGDYIHAKENESLQWNGNNLGPTGGAMGAYTEAVNILNEKDYRIYEIYNVVASFHPEVKTNTNKDPHQMNDVNNYYHLKVSYIPRDVNSIKNALIQGKLVQAITDTNLFRNSSNKLVNWSGRHWGLIFYYDGEYFHMKNAGSIRQKNAIYTESQLSEWLDSKNIKGRPIVYEKAVK